LRRELPEARIAVGLWAADEDPGNTRERLLKLGVDQVLMRVAETSNVLRQLAQKQKPAANESTPKHSARG
jgi:hypothetical protein